MIIIDLAGGSVSIIVISREESDYPLNAMVGINLFMSVPFVVYKYSWLCGIGWND